MSESGKSRYFDSGATRDTDEGKLDYEGFLSPNALTRYATYMHSHRKQSDGKMRDSDNWQKGIPLTAYFKSLWRHVVEAWTLHRSGLTPGGGRYGEEMKEVLCAIIFNAFGYLHEITKDDEKDLQEELNHWMGDNPPTHEYPTEVDNCDFFAEQAAVHRRGYNIPIYNYWSENHPYKWRDGYYRSEHEDAKMRSGDENKEDDVPLEVDKGGHGHEPTGRMFIEDHDKIWMEKRESSDPHGITYWTQKKIEETDGKVACGDCSHDETCKLPWHSIVLGVDCSTYRKKVQ
jgi:hypothetical protein